MFRLVYVSSAVAHFGSDELLDLLVKARHKNDQQHITGLLLCKDGNFMQVLEGEESAVRQLFITIEKDARHRGTIVLMEDQVDERLFGKWSMGFRNLTDAEVLATEGFNPFMNHALDLFSFKDDPSGCLELLNLFRQGR
jgi:hypothetical protein